MMGLCIVGVEHFFFEKFSTLLHVEVLILHYLIGRSTSHVQAKGSLNMCVS